MILAVLALSGRNSSSQKLPLSGSVHVLRASPLRPWTATMLSHFKQNSQPWLRPWNETRRKVGLFFLLAYSASRHLLSILSSGVGYSTNKPCGSFRLVSTLFLLVLVTKGLRNESIFHFGSQCDQCDN